MSILIKGMAMPTRCFNCPMCELGDEEIWCSVSHGAYVEYQIIDEKIAIQDKPSWCPLVEIPPHGRLIDADALKGKDFRYDIHGTQTARVVFARAIELAPTIIESEGDENGIHT